MSQIVQPSSDPSGAESDSPALQDVAETLIRNKSVILKSIYEPIRQELAEVEAILQRELKSDAPWVEQLLEHSRVMGGKRMRPVFLLLSGACCGGITQAHLNFSTALEMIHTATLIHDDVLDAADHRRHQPTANSRWGNKASVLLGDYLFTHAFHVACFSDSAVALRVLAAASNRVCAGEMRQNAWIGNFELTEDEYLLVISEKTAELCSCACHLGALLSNADESIVACFEGFGQNLGIAFQIVDDVLDLVGNPTKVGKTLGTDLTNKKPTLPVIHSLENLDEIRRGEFLELLDKSDVSVDDVIPYLNATGSIEYARSVAADHGQRASQFAQQLPPNEYSEALTKLAGFVLERNH